MPQNRLETSQQILCRLNCWRRSVSSARSSHSGVKKQQTIWVRNQRASCKGFDQSGGEMAKYWGRLHQRGPPLLAGNGPGDRLD